jgi:hypothetical protein
MSKKKVVKKTTKRPVKKSLKPDPKFMTPIVPESFIKQYKKDLIAQRAEDRKNTINTAKEIFKDSARKAESLSEKITKSLERQGIKRKSDDVSTDSKSWEKLDSLPVEEFRQSLDSINAKTPQTPVFDPLQSLYNVKFGTNYRPNKKLQEDFSDDLIVKFVDVFDVAPSEEDLKAFKFVLKGVQSEHDLKSLRTRDIRKIAIEQGYVPPESNDNDPDIYETLKERTADKMSAKEYVQTYHNLSEDVLNELQKNLTHTSDDVEKSQKGLENFEKTLVEKTAAYYKAKRDLFVFKKAYDSAFEEVFGKV